MATQYRSSHGLWCTLLSKSMDSSSYQTRQYSKNKKCKTRPCTTQIDSPNWSRDPHIVVGDLSLAKKIPLCKFINVCKVLVKKGHPFPLNSIGEPHCFSWHLWGKCKTNCHQKANHIHPPAEVISKLIDRCVITVEGRVSKRLSRQPTVVPAPRTTASVVWSKKHLHLTNKLKIF